MFTPIFDVVPECSDLMTYAKWFKINSLNFEIKMHDVDKWTASSRINTFTVETPFLSGPSAAVKELHKILSPMIAELKNV